MPLLALAPLVAGCRLHLDYVTRNQSAAMLAFDSVMLGEHDRQAILSLMGPPDLIRFAPEFVAFGYESARHRATEFEVFLPSEVIPGIDPLILLAAPRILFDPSDKPEVLEPSTFERVGRGGARLLGSLVPFASGEEILTLKGNQVRGDLMAIVFDRESWLVIGKSLQLATESYREETLPGRVFLQAD